MSRFTIIVWIIVIALLNVVTLNESYQLDETKLSDLSLTHSVGDLLASNAPPNGDQQLIEVLNRAEFDNALAKSPDELASLSQLYGCQLVQIVHLLRHPGCQPKAIASFACTGSCSSYVKASTSDFWQRERSCSCCQQTGSQEATFALDCPSLDPPYRKVKTRAPTGCLCRSCTDLTREDIRPQELVEALAGESKNDS